MCLMEFGSVVWYECGELLGGGLKWNLGVWKLAINIFAKVRKLFWEED